MEESRIKLSGNSGTQIEGHLPFSDPEYQVLVVDDYLETLELIKKFLGKAGISCRAVLNGSDALEIIASGNIPRVVLLDIMMPGLSGYSVCRTLRKTFAATELPIIMLTGRTEIEALVEAYQSGANDYISKPFSMDELITRVRCHLDLQQAHRTFRKNLRLEMELVLQKQKKEAARLTAKKQEREKLRYQINPHFLFNSLTSIRGAIFSDREAAHQMISHLAEFCRLSLSQGAKNIHSITREISIIDHYLSMEKLRFGNYMNLFIDMEPDTKHIIIPAFILQPLAENAVKYGTQTSPDYLDIHIIVKFCPGKRISIKVSNTGTWVPPDSADPRTSNGIGIKNIRERLATFYSDQYQFETQEKDGQVSMLMIFPDILF